MFNDVRTHWNYPNSFIFANWIYDALRNHLSCFTCHVSGVQCHLLTFPWPDLQFSHNIHYTLCVQCHMSHVRCHLSGVTCPVSHVTCHVSCVMCYVSYVIFFFFTKWLSCLVEALLSTGPTPSGFKIFFLLKTLWYTIFTISACIGPFWVIKKSKFMRNQF